MGSSTRDQLQEEEEEEEVQEICLGEIDVERDRKRMCLWAKRGELCKKRGINPLSPPFAILDHPDLFERAWGWDNIYPWDRVNSFSRYKTYLQDYYKHNQSEVNTEDLNGGNDLAALARSCTKMEGHLMYLLDLCTGNLTADDKMEIRLTSEKISKRAHEMTNVLESEFPAAAICLKCITKEAELMTQLLLCGPAQAATSSITTSNDIRCCALSFMTYREHEYVPAAAAMMGVMKEAELMRELLRKPEHYRTEDKILRALFLRDNTLFVMLDMCHECSSVGEPTGGSISTNLNFTESDGMTFPENKVIENKDESNGKNSEKEVARNSLGERNGINENKGPKEKLTRNSLKKRNKAETFPENKIIENKDESNGRNSEKEVARNILGERNGINENKGSKEELKRNSLGKSNKLMDMLKIQLSPLDGKAGKKAEVEQKKQWKACFSWPKPGGRANGAAGYNDRLSA